jgi:2OG-Fe(II) oxygenase superfamily
MDFDTNRVNVIEGIVTPEDCRSMIDYYDSLVMEGKFKKLFDNRLVIPNTTLKKPINLVEQISEAINTRYGTKFYIRDVLLSIYKTSAYIAPHYDYEDPNLKDSLGVVLYLNEDFEGGELYFSNHNYTYKPTLGSVITFPCNDPLYEHGVRPVTSGVRYTMPIELTSKEEFSIL